MDVFIISPIIKTTRFSNEYLPFAQYEKTKNRPIKLWTNIPSFLSIEGSGANNFYFTTVTTGKTHHFQITIWSEHCADVYLNHHLNQRPAKGSVSMILIDLK